MAEHESCVGASDDRYTPPHIFSALGIEFDLDPCSPGRTQLPPIPENLKNAEETK